MVGILIIDPPDVTRKHNKQSSWKRTAILQFPGDETDKMWRWYIKKRYGLELNQPLRQCHITIVNDRYQDTAKWNEFKSKFNHTNINIDVSRELRSNGEHWWLRVDENEEIKAIRTFLNLGEPFFKYHLTIGLANSRNIKHSEYILRQILNYY